MVDDFFQQKPKHSFQSTSLKKRSVLFHSLFYTSFAGFILGSLLGYLHIKGWIASAEGGLILYAITLGITAILSSSFVLYQVRQNQRQPAKVKQR